jgi:hypothetical protein
VLRIEALRLDFDRLSLTAQCKLVGALFSKEKATAESLTPQRAGTPKTFYKFL